MKYLIFVIFIAPTLIILLATIVLFIFGIDLLWSFGVPRSFALFPFLCFVISVPISFAFPNEKLLKIAAVVNTIPVLLLLLFYSLFWITH